MAENKIKTKDMLIAIFCTFLTVLCIVFYFLPSFSVEHSPNLNLENSEVLTYSAWDMTRAAFTTSKDLESNLIGLMYIKDVYGVAIIISGIMMTIGIICEILTTIFAYLSWFKGEKFKKYCFLFGLCGMLFSTITLISTWFIAIQVRSGNVYLDYFNSNIKGSILYGSFVSLILSFVIAIIACAYNYFLDNFDDEDDEQEQQTESDEINEIEEKFVSAIGNRCEIKGNLSKGKLMIRYRSQQDLERIYSLLSDGGELFTE